MWWLELSLIGVVAYSVWRLHRLELKVDALERMYNELADMYDRKFSED